MYIGSLYNEHGRRWGFFRLKFFQKLALTKAVSSLFKYSVIGVISFHDKISKYCNKPLKPDF